MTEKAGTRAAPWIPAMSMPASQSRAGKSVALPTEESPDAII